MIGLATRFLDSRLDMAEWTDSHDDSMPRLARPMGIHWRLERICDSDCRLDERYPSSPARSSRGTNANFLPCWKMDSHHTIPDSKGPHNVRSRDYCLQLLLSGLCRYPRTYYRQWKLWLRGFGLRRRGNRRARLDFFFCFVLCCPQVIFFVHSC